MSKLEMKKKHGGSGPLERVRRHKLSKRTKTGMARGMAKLIARSAKERERVAQGKGKKFKTIPMPSSEWWLQHAKKPKVRNYRVMVQSVSIAAKSLGADTILATDAELDGTPRVELSIRFEKGLHPVKVGDYYKVTLERITIAKPIKTEPIQ